MFFLQCIFTALVGLQFTPAEGAFVVESVIQQKHWKLTKGTFTNKFGKEISKSQI